MKRAPFRRYDNTERTRSAFPLTRVESRPPHQAIPWVVIMERMKADKPTVMQRQVDLLNARYDLSDRPAEGATMFRGKQVQQGVRVKLPQGVLATSLKRQAERSLNCFGNKIAAFVVYESVGACVREKTIALAKRIDCFQRGSSAASRCGLQSGAMAHA